MKKGIIVVSFGTSEVLGLKQNIENINNRLKKEFKDEYEILNAFTSNFIIKKLKEKSNIYVLSFNEALDKFYKRGINEVIVVPLYILPGGQYEEVKKSLNKYHEKFNSIKISKPLLSGEEEDFQRVVLAMANDLPKDKEIVLVGHGTKDKYSRYYKILEEYFHKNKFTNIHIGTLEGGKENRKLARELKELGIHSVYIVPFLIVCGFHVVKDIDGDNKNSWKNVFKDEGFDVEVNLKSLGEYEKILDLYVEKIKELV